MARREWTREYHTLLSGTTLSITLDGPYITIRAIEKPYKITARIDQLEELARWTG